MYKHGVIIGAAVICAVGIYVINPFALEKSCIIEEGGDCSQVSQVRADNQSEVEEDINEFIQIENQDDTASGVSKMAIEKREQLKQAQIKAELEAQREIEYKEKLLEEGKEVVAEYEAERQEKLTDK